MKALKAYSFTTDTITKITPEHMLCGLIAALRDTIRQYYIKVPQAEPIGGLPESKNWVFRGPQNDTLGLHEHLAMDISGKLDWWSPRTKYVEVRDATQALALTAVSI